MKSKSKIRQIYIWIAFILAYLLWATITQINSQIIKIVTVLVIILLVFFIRYVELIAT